MVKRKELSAVEAATRLRINLDYLYRLLLTGRLEGQKVDGKWRIPAAAVEARLKQRWEREMLPNKPRLRHADGRPYRPRRHRKAGQPDVGTPADVSADPVTLADLWKGR